MSTTMHAPPSSVPLLDYRYEVGELIGRGGFARVYAARDRLLGIPVAIKIMDPEWTKSKGLVDAFTREAELTSRMLSPHIAKVLGRAVTSAGTPCIVYERLEGETLAERIERTGALTLAATTDIVRQVARALTRVHAVGVVHRDVKPENVFLTDQPNGRPLVKLIDFGIADSVGPNGAIGTDVVAGTPEYMAPEIVQRAQRADARADVYALGVLAFECLTGRCPFVASTLDEVRALIERGERARLLDLRPDLPIVMDHWVEQALHPDPYWRFASAKALVDGLDLAMRRVSADRAQRLAA